MTATEPTDAEYAAAREALVCGIEREMASLPARAFGRGLDRRVAGALSRVPRHAFVPPFERRMAYADRALPIGEGQTISQPYIVALMTQLLALSPGEKVLEIGTGSGYQAAVLVEMGVCVFSVEYVAALAEHAREVLDALGYEAVEIQVGDGALGWPEHAPFDAIIVTAATEHVPPALIEQLGPGGRMAIPLGPVSDTQYLTVVRKDRSGRIRREEVTAVRFVPLL